MLHSVLKCSFNNIFTLLHRTIAGPETFLYCIMLPHYNTGSQGNAWPQKVAEIVTPGQ